MPNYITNILICHDTEILESLINDEGHFDFNIITPMPDYIRNTVCGGIVEYEDHEIDDYQEREKTRRPLTEEEIKKGANEGWYDWARRNWGTKWNASETKILHYDIYSFQTAWNPPIAFLTALSKKHTHIPFYLYWKDEGADGGFNQQLFLNCD